MILYLLTRGDLTKHNVPPRSIRATGDSVVQMVLEEGEGPSGGRQEWRFPRRVLMGHVVEGSVHSQFFWAPRRGGQRTGIWATTY